MFVVEPSGRYRASADLSIGGGVLGSMNMGQAYAHVVATNNEVQFNNFTADVFKGRASGNARVAIGRGGTSQVNAEFNQVDVAGPLTALWAAPCRCSRDGPSRSDVPWHRFQTRYRYDNDAFDCQAGEAGAEQDSDYWRSRDARRPRHLRHSTGKPANTGDKVERHLFFENDSDLN